MEGLRKIKPILANPQLHARIIYFGVGLPMPDASTTSKENLPKALDNSIIFGEEVAILEDQGKKEGPPTTTPVSPIQLLQGEPIAMCHLQEEVPKIILNEGIPSN